MARPASRDRLRATLTTRVEVAPHETECLTLTQGRRKHEDEECLVRVALDARGKAPNLLSAPECNIGLGDSRAAARRKRMLFRTKLRHVWADHSFEPLVGNLNCPIAVAVVAKVRHPTDNVRASDAVRATIPRVGITCPSTIIRYVATAVAPIRSAASSTYADIASETDVRMSPRKYAPTTVTQSRVSIFAATKRKRGCVETVTVKNGWGFAEVTGDLTQIHRTILDAISASDGERFIRRVTDRGELEVAVSPHALLRILGHDHPGARDFKWLEEMIDDLRTVGFVPP